MLICAVRLPPATSKLAPPSLPLSPTAHCLPSLLIAALPPLAFPPCAAPHAPSPRRNLTRPLTLKERCHIAWQATLGMAYLHDQSPAVIHFDLKPDNLLVDGEGDHMVVKVADFGLSKHKFHSHVSCRDLRGTLPYMAPELVNNPNMVGRRGWGGQRGDPQGGGGQVGEGRGGGRGAACLCWQGHEGLRLRCEWLRCDC